MTNFYDLRRAARGETPTSTRQRATTIIPRPDAGIAGLRYHTTYVVIAYADGSFTLRHGGFMSATTRRRMNTYTPDGIHVYQRAHVWYVDTPTGTYPYGEGMCISATGDLVDEGDRSQGTYDRDALAARCDEARQNAA